jgi:uncharacterized RDD family membrane protein YckC
MLPTDHESRALPPLPASPLSPPPLPSLAGLWRRFGAFVHELLFLVAYLFIVGLFFASISGESMSAGRPQILTGTIALLQQLYLFATLGAYFVFFWIKGRRTLAFKTWQLRLVDARDLLTPPSLKHAVLRYLSTWIGPALGLLIYLALGANARGWWLLALFTNFLWAFVDPARQFLHDRIAGTRVTHVRE